MRVPVTYPMCSQDIEHMTHLFIDCEFAAGCWDHAQINYDWMTIELAHEWLLEKISTRSIVEVTQICIILWTI